MTVKYLPEINFDKPNVLSREEAYKALYKYCEADMQAACAKAWQEGMEIGEQQAKQSLEALTHSVSLEIKTHLEKLRQEEKERGDALFLNAITIAQTITQKLLPVWAETHGLEEIKSVVSDALKVARNQANIEVWVHPDLTAKLYAALDDELTIHGDGALSHMDCKVEWQTGGYEKIMSTIWRDIDAVLNAYTSQAKVRLSFDKENLIQ